MAKRPGALGPDHLGLDHPELVPGCCILMPNKYLFSALGPDHLGLDHRDLVPVCLIFGANKLSFFFEVVPDGLVMGGLGMG